MNEEKDNLGLIPQSGEAPEVNRTQFTVEEEKQHKNIVTEKHSGRLYPCTVCGKEKVKQSRTGHIPKYCKECLKGIRLTNLKKARIAQYKEKAYEATIDVKMPDGSVASVRDDIEKTFLEERFKQYTKEFDWKESADYGLLTKLLLLELQTDRIGRLLTLKYTDGKASTLAKLTDEIRQCQRDLGITRLKRIDEKDTTDAHTIVRSMMKKFKDYQEKHPERFMWRCSKCGEINKIDKENKLEVVE